MLTVEDVTPWLQSLESLNGLWSTVGISSEPGWIDPNIPGAQLVITPDPGGPTLDERTIDQLSIHILFRGAGGDSANTAQQVKLLDNTLMGLKPPFSINGNRCISLDYLGGGPRWLARDNAMRHHWTASYVLLVARTVF